MSPLFSGRVECTRAVHAYTLTQTNAHQNMLKYMLTPTEHVTGLSGPWPDLPLHTQIHLYIRTADSPLPPASQINPVHPYKNTFNFPLQTVNTHQTCSYTKHSHMCNLYRHTWMCAACLRACVCTDLAVVFECTSQRWRKKQKINMGLMGSIVIPTSCHSQRLFTAQQ